MKRYCDFRRSLTCPTCGYKAKRRPHVRVCRPPRDTFRPVDVGKIVERGLKSIGVTPALLERVTGKPGGCGCQRRKQWLTEAGNDVQYKARAALLAARKFYVGD